MEAAAGQDVGLLTAVEASAGQDVGLLTAVEAAAGQDVSLLTAVEAAAGQQSVEGEGIPGIHVIGLHRVILLEVGDVVGTVVDSSSHRKSPPLACVVVSSGQNP